MPAGHQYQAFISDIAGFDPETHDGSASGIVTTVMAWLATRADAVRTLNPQQVIAVLPKFEAEMRELRDIWGPSPPWEDVVLAALKVAQQCEAAE